MKFSYAFFKLIQLKSVFYRSVTYLLLVTLTGQTVGTAFATPNGVGASTAPLSSHSETLGRDFYFRLAQILNTRAIPGLSPEDLVPDLEEAVARFDENLHNRIEFSGRPILHETTLFLEGLLSLIEAEKLPKTALAENSRGLKITLPESDQIRTLAKLLISRWTTKKALLGEDKSCPDSRTLPMQAALAFYFSIGSFLPIMQSCENSRQVEGSICSYLISGGESKARDLMMTTSLFVLSFVSFYVLLSQMIPLGHDWMAKFNHKWLKYDLANNEKALEALLSDQSKLYGVPRLTQIAKQCIKGRLLAEPAWNEDLECPICLEEYHSMSSLVSDPARMLYDSEEAKIEITSCGHKFHVRCLDESRKSADQRGYRFICPICRQALGPDPVEEDE